VHDQHHPVHDNELAPLDDNSYQTERYSQHEVICKPTSQLTQRVRQWREGGTGQSVRPTPPC
jgi:hypothetical protein